MFGVYSTMLVHASAVQIRKVIGSQKEKKGGEGTVLQWQLLLQVTTVYQIQYCS